jgi:cell division protein FtsI (penicillin-binding protein 3)
MSERRKRISIAIETPEQQAERERAQLRSSRKWRVWLLSVLLFAGVGRVVTRAYEIQVKNRKEYERRYRQEIEVQAKRGNIYDRSGAELAVSVDLDSFFVDPLALRNNGLEPEEVVRKLARVLKVEAGPLVDRIQGKRRFIWIKRRVTPAESQAVAQLGVLGKGVGTRKEPRRFYPNLSTAAHVLGFTDDQGRGVEGLERAFETRLRGATDKVSAIFDARGGVVFSEELMDAQSAQGHHLSLTLDREIQVIAERELELGVRAVEARAGHVVVMDPQTGEILALANYPTFNPNAPGGAEPATRRNRAVADRFEPGSVMKTFTIAGALAQGAIHESQQIDCENGAMRVADAVIHDTHRYGLLTPGEILAHSSNIGTAKIGSALGKRGLFQTLREFGFGVRTGVELPSETEGVLRAPERWYEVDAATVAFGQGMSVTNLQLATAMSAVANGGKVLKPLIVSRVTDMSGKVIEQIAPTVKRRAVPAEIAEQVGEMLTAVVGPNGTGGAAAMPGYVVAGKTGTAQKADERGGYAENRWTSTFVGYVPANRPRLVVSVVIDEPTIEHYGGAVAGPVFRRIATESLRHLGVSPAASEDKLADAIKAARDQRRVQERPTQPTVHIEERAPVEGKVRVPNLQGLGARAALVTLAQAGLGVTLAGSGAAVEQSPSPGVLVSSGATVHVVLRRPGELDRVQTADRKRRPRDIASGPLASIASRRVVQ